MKLHQEHSPIFLKYLDFRMVRNNIHIIDWKIRSEHVVINYYLKWCIVKVFEKVTCATISEQDLVTL